MAWEAGRNYSCSRYMLRLQFALGMWPTKVQWRFIDRGSCFLPDTSNKLYSDYRNWGGGLHTMQKSAVGFIPDDKKNGDWDMLQAQFDFLPEDFKNNAELRSKVYWNHSGGLSFTEQMETLWLGLTYAEYGQNRPANFDKGL